MFYQISEKVDVNNARWDHAEKKLAISQMEHLWIGLTMK